MVREQTYVVNLVGDPTPTPAGGSSIPGPVVGHERKAKRAWKAENARRAEARQPLVEWFGLHEARHSFATFLDHAGISETRSNRYMGHSLGALNYRHLLPDQLTKDAGRLDEYLAGALAGKIVELPRTAERRGDR